MEQWHSRGEILVSQRPPIQTYQCYMKPLSAVHGYYVLVRTVSVTISLIIKTHRGCKIFVNMTYTQCTTLQWYSDIASHHGGETAKRGSVGSKRLSMALCCTKQAGGKGLRVVWCARSDGDLHPNISRVAATLEYRTVRNSASSNDKFGFVRASVLLTPSPHDLIIM